MVAHAVETGTIAKDVLLAEVQEILDGFANDFACQIEPCKAWVAKKWHTLSCAQRFAVWNALETGHDKLWQAAEQDHGQPSPAALRFYTLTVAIFKTLCDHSPTLVKQVKKKASNLTPHALGHHDAYRQIGHRTALHEGTHKTLWEAGLF
ncbi:uncharacterized protein JCM10292_001073 [Rhodotorula paludigena]|uniref:uncharacterized protein n=1 Tax=Rhodotorula paludigena TaxID=86838 RepID=UPI0031739041